MKKCTRCKIYKSLDQFYASGNQSNGKRSECKECTIQSIKKYRLIHREQINLWKREYRKRCNEKNPTGVKRKRYDRYNVEMERTKRRELKIQIIQQYSEGSNACNCCGEKMIEFLSLDHIFNDGNLERKNKPYNTAGTYWYKKLQKLGFPRKDRYQILCYNCNLAKSFYGGRCPHKITNAS